jgi:hypothetical protein
VFYIVLSTGINKGRKVLYFQKLSKFKKVGVLLSESEVLRGF